MDIQFSCSNCGQHIAVDESGAGLTIQCPACSQDLVVPVPTARAVATPAPTTTAVRPKEVQTNVKQGALIGGWVCFIVTAICLIAPFPTFFLWIPLALAAFILSITAMSQRRVIGGFALLLVTVIGGPILWFSGTRGFVKNAMKTSTHESTPSLKAASESPATDKSSVPVQPVSQTADSPEQQPLPPSTAIIPVETKASTQEPKALDVKGGFREYRLGVKKSDINSELMEMDSPFGRDDKDTDKYWVKTFDHSLGSFQIESICLEFDHTLGILKDVTVYVKGKQNIAGVLETLKAAYGEPEKSESIFANNDYSWKGADIELRYQEEGFGDSTWASWTSKKVEKLIEDDRTRRAKEGAAGAAKGL